MSQLVDLLLRHRADPREYLVDAAGGRLSYAETVAEVERRAAVLARLGYADARVLLVFERSIAAVIAYWSLLYAGNTIVLAGPSLPAAALIELAERARSVRVIASSDIARQLAAVLEPDRGPAPQLLAFDHDEPARVGSSPTPAAERDHDPELAVLAPTSGTTSAPKLVCWTHANLIHNARAHTEGLGLTRDDRGLIALPLESAVAHTAQLLGHTRLGGAVLLGGAGPLCPRRCAQLARAEAATVASLVPAFASMLARQRELADAPLRLLTIGGDRSDPALFEALARRMPSCRLAHTYGLTEAGPRVSMLVGELERLPSIGRPLPGVEVVVLDDSGDLATTGAVGQLCVRGPSVSPGYFDDVEHSAQTFRDGWLHTGDLAACDADGYLELRGRVDTLIISGGVRVSPELVEATLCRHPEIHAARVRAEDQGPFASIVVADIVAHNPPTLHELHRFLVDQLHRAHWPRRLYACTSLPQTRAGKVARWTA